MSFKKYPYYLGSIVNLLTGFRPVPLVVRYFLKLAPPGVQVLEIPGAQVRLKVREPMDIWSVKETFLDRFYERFGFPIQAGWTIIDIGGGLGDFTIYAARRPNTRLFAFEPTPDSFALLQENLRLNQIHNVRAFQEAVWSQATTLTIDTSPGRPGQFTSHRTAEQAAPQQKIQVPATPFEYLFDRLELTRCDLMKIDCEGAEYEILLTASTQALQRVQRIVMEYHDGVADANHQDLARFLSAQGFQVESFPNYVHDDLGYLRAWRV